jgi:Protein of unknown function (DUF3072)
MSRSSLGRGITNAQAKYLAALQREAGEQYTGNGMSRLQASREIERLERQLRLFSPAIPPEPSSPPSPMRPAQRGAT